MTQDQHLAEQWKAAIDSVLGLALHCLGRLRFDRNNGQHLVAVCLYARLTELATANAALIEAKALAGVPALVRSMFEADIDLTNCLRSKDYFRSMYARFVEEKVKITRTAVSCGSSPFFSEIRRVRDSQRDLAEAEAELQKLVAAGHRPLSIRARAEAAGRLNEYLSIYSLLCLDSHNNVNALERWHVEKDAEGRHQVMLFKMATSDQLCHLTAIHGILLSQTKAVSDFFSIKEVDCGPCTRERVRLESATRCDSAVGTHCS